MPVPFSDLQAISPSSIIELFELQLNTAQHGTNDVYRFHAGSSLNANGEIVWAGNSYMRFPVEASGFEYSGNGQLPRPKIRVSNILGTITAVLASVNSSSPGNDLTGAKLTRIRTLARYIDAVNFPDRRNLLTNTNTFNWSETSTSAANQSRWRQSNAAIAPDGETTATKISASPDSDLQRIFTTVSGLTANQPVTFSVYVKAGEYDRVSIRASTVATANAIFDLTNGKWLVSSNASAQFSVDASNGWYRLGITYTPTTTSTTVWVQIANSSNQVTFQGDGNSGLYLWGAQVEAASAVSAYQPVGATWSRNPLGTPDPTVEFPREVYYVDRKTAETRDIVEFELAAVFDLAGVRAPKRQCISSVCQWTYRSAECGYTYKSIAAPATSVNITTNEIYIASHGLVTGDLLRIATTPGGTPMTISGVQLAQDGISALVSRNLRYAIKINDNIFLLASTQARAFAGFSDDIQGAGSGAHTFQHGFYFNTDAQCPTPADDDCGKRLFSCRLRFGSTGSLPFGSFPGVGTYSA